MTATTAPARRRAVPSIAVPEDWMTLGLCNEVGSDIFFPEVGESVKPAKSVCRRCEVEEECLAYALDNDERFGVWGGLSERERRKLKRA